MATSSVQTSSANPISHGQTPFPRWKFPQWQPQYEDAILEFDTVKLPSLVETASVAIFIRLESPEITPEELRALAAALRSVRVKVKRLNRRSGAPAVAK